MDPAVFSAEASAGKGKGFGGATWPGAGDEDLVNATTIPTERIGDLIGPRGIIIQRIKQLSGASKVHVEEELPGQTLTPVQAAGSDAAVLKVAELVEAVLKGQHEELGFVKETLPMPTPPHGRPVAHIIKHISAQSGAWVQLLDGEGCLTLTGLPNAVAQAKQMLQSDGLHAGGCDGTGLQNGQDGGALMPPGGKGGWPWPGRPYGPSGPQGSCKGQKPWGGGPPPGPGPYSRPPGPHGMAPSPRRPPFGGMPPRMPMQPGLPKGGYGGPPGQPLTSTSFEIPAHRVKDILGVKGMNVKAIKAQSRIQKIDLVDRSDPATVTLTGTQEAVDMAKHMVLSIAAGDQTVIGNIVETIDVDQRLVSKLIGAKGQAINQIKDASGCYLEVRETGAGQTPRVIMTGPKENVERAKDLVTRFLIEQSTAATAAAQAAAQAASVVNVPPRPMVPASLPTMLPTAGGVPGVDAYTQMLTDAQAQLQAQLLLQAQLSQLSQLGAGGCAAPSMDLTAQALQLQQQQGNQQQLLLQQALLQQQQAQPQVPQQPQQPQLQQQQQQQAALPAPGLEAQQAGAQPPAEAPQSQVKGE